MEKLGHGHVVPRPDGLKAKCGGPVICLVCALELSMKQTQNYAEMCDEKDKKIAELEATCDDLRVHWTIDSKAKRDRILELECELKARDA